MKKTKKISKRVAACILAFAMAFPMMLLGPGTANAAGIQETPEGPETSEVSETVSANELVQPALLAAATGDPYTSFNANDVFYIKARRTDSGNTKELNAANVAYMGYDSGAVKQIPYGNANNNKVKWKFVNKSGDYYQMICLAEPNKILSIEGGGGRDQDYSLVNPSTADTTYFKIVTVSNDGYQIVSKSSGDGQAANARGLTNGMGDIKSWDQYSGDANNKWYIIPATQSTVTTFPLAQFDDTTAYALKLLHSDLNNNQGYGGTAKFLTPDLNEIGNDDVSHVSKRLGPGTEALTPKWKFINKNGDYYQMQSTADTQRVLYVSAGNINGPKYLLKKPSELTPEELKGTYFKVVVPNSTNSNTLTILTYRSADDRCISADSPVNNVGIIRNHEFTGSGNWKQWYFMSGDVGPDPDFAFDEYNTYYIKARRSDMNNAKRLTDSGVTLLGNNAGTIGHIAYGDENNNNVKWKFKHVAGSYYQLICQAEPNKYLTTSDGNSNATYSLGTDANSTKTLFKFEEVDLGDDSAYMITSKESSDEHCLNARGSGVVQSWGNSLTDTNNHWFIFVQPEPEASLYNEGVDILSGNVHPDNYYYLKTNRSDPDNKKDRTINTTSKYASVEISGGSAQAIANKLVQSAFDGKSARQKFRFVKLDNGAYQLWTRTNEGDRTVSRVAIAQNISANQSITFIKADDPGASGTNTHFKIERRSNGKYVIRAASNQSLYVRPETTNNTKDIILSTNSDANSEWYIEAPPNKINTTRPFVYRQPFYIKARMDDPNDSRKYGDTTSMYLTYSDTSTTDVKKMPWTGDANQQWYFMDKGKGIVEIVSMVDSNKVLRLAGSADSSNYELSTTKDGNALFRIEKVFNSTARVANAYKILTGASNYTKGMTASGTSGIAQANASSNNNQQWFLEIAEIMNPLYDSAGLRDQNRWVENGKGYYITSDRRTYMQSTSSNSDAQLKNLNANNNVNKWKIEYENTSQGTFRISSVENSGRYLTVDGTNTKLAAKDTNSATQGNQIFKLQYWRIVSSNYEILNSSNNPHNKTRILIKGTNPSAEYTMALHADNLNDGAQIICVAAGNAREWHFESARGYTFAFENELKNSAMLRVKNHAADMYYSFGLKTKINPVEKIVTKSDTDHHAGLAVDPSFDENAYKAVLNEYTKNTEKYVLFTHTKLGAASWVYDRIAIVKGYSLMPHELAHFYGTHDNTKCDPLQGGEGGDCVFCVQGDLFPTDYAENDSRFGTRHTRCYNCSELGFNSMNYVSVLWGGF